VTDTNGLVAKSNVASITDTYTSPSVTISPTSVTLDVNQNQNFTSTVSGGASPYSYQWYKNGSAVSTNSYYLFSSSSAGTFLVYVNVTDNFGIRVKSNTAIVTVHSGLGVSISPTLVTTDVGQFVTFTATASGGSGVYSSYQWYVDGQLQSDQTSTFVYSSSAGSQGTHSITVTVTDSLGATSPQSSPPATVMVNAALVAPAVTASPSTVDQGQTSILSNSTVISTGTPSYSYQWFEKAPSAGAYSAIGGATLTSYSFLTSVSTSTGVWYFELNVTDATGAVVTSNAVTVTVNTVPSVTISPSSATLDVGQSQVFTATASGGSGSLSYQWYIDGSAVSGATGASWTFTSSSTGSHTVYVTVTDSVRMQATSKNATVTVNPALSVSVSPSPVVLDVGQSQTFTSSVSGGTSPYSYQWYLNGTVISGATGSTYTFAPSSRGHYNFYVVVKDTVGVLATSNTATATVNSALSVTVSPTSVTLTVGQSQTFTSTVSGGTSPYSYQWYLNGAAVSGATSASWTFTPSSAGSYRVYVRVTDKAGMQATSNTATVRVRRGSSGAAATDVASSETAIVAGESIDMNATFTNDDN
jgi:hypothetical protein